MVGHEPVVAGAAEEDVAQEVAGVLVLDLGDRVLPREHQRRQVGRPLEQRQVVVADRALRAHRDQPGQVVLARDDPHPARLAGTDPGRRARPILQPLHAHPPAGRQQVDLGQRRPQRGGQRCGPLPTVGRGDQHTHLEHPRDLARDRVEVAALEHQPRQPAVQPVDARQRTGRDVRLHAVSRHLAQSEASRAHRWHNLTWEAP